MQLLRLASSQVYNRAGPDIQGTATYAVHALKLRVWIEAWYWKKFGWC